MHIGLFEVGLASCCFFAERAGSGHLKIDKGASGDPMVLDGPSQLVTPAASVIPRGPSDWIIVGEKVEPWEAFVSFIVAGVEVVKSTHLGLEWLWLCQFRNIKELSVMLKPPDRRGRLCLPV